jgi:hypothetical protein
VIALELVGRQVAVIVANTPGVLAVKAAITTTPIVFTTGSDPVQIGLVASLSRPGGNVTGVTALAVELAPKLLELAHELVPTASVIAALINPTNRNTAERLLRDLQAAAHALGLQLRVVHEIWGTELLGFSSPVSTAPFRDGSQIRPYTTLMWRWTKTTMRSNMSPVLERSGECPACRSASIYSRTISPPAFR